MEGEGGMPLVAVVFDTGSAGPLEVVRAAEGLCDVVFLADSNRPGVQHAAELLEELGEVCDITGRDIYDIADELRGLKVSGLVTFSEYQIGLTARLAHVIGARFHHPEVANALTHKAAQRTRLARAGLETIRFRTVDRPDGLDAALAEVGFPAVVKPTVGAASRNAYAVWDPSQCQDLAPVLLEEGELIVEEMLIGDPGVAGHGWGDYVSVDAVSLEGKHHLLGVVGKFPLMPPFRESGMLLPSTLDDRTREAVRDLAFAALDALGVAWGVSHTEIKLTAGGPRIIEVNGRLGGHVGDLLLRGTGLDAIRVALLAALADARATQAGVAQVGAEATGDVVFSLFLAPPASRVRLNALRGIETVKSLPGVESVSIQARAGSVLDFSLGTETYLGVVKGRTAGHATLAALAKEIGGAVGIDCAPLAPPSPC